MRHVNKMLWALVIVLAIPSLYLLSIGPAYWLYSRDWITLDTYREYSLPAWKAVRRLDNQVALDAYYEFVAFFAPPE
jgi:hypothetical protein